MTNATKNQIEDFT